MAKRSTKKFFVPSISQSHYGYPDVNSITVGSRFFFFQTLQNGSEEESPEAGNYRLRIYQTAMGILNEQGLQNQEDNKGAEQIQAALNFLKSAADYQRKHEREIWEKQVLQIFKGTQYEKMAEACFPANSNNINYYDFINLLGLMETDTEDKNRWLRRLQQSYNQTVQFNNEISKINGSLNASPELLNAFGPQKLISKIYKNGYGQRREIAAATKSMLDTPKLNRALLGSKRSEFFHSLTQDLTPIINRLLSTTENKITIMSDDARLGFSAEIAHQMLDYFYDSLKDNQGGGRLDKISYSEFERMFFNIKNNGKKDINEQQFKILLKKGEQLLKNIKLLEEQGQNIRETPKERVSVSINKKTRIEEIVGLTKNIRLRLQETLSDQENIVQFFKENEDTDFRSAKARKKFITELKQYLAPLIQNDATKRNKITNAQYVEYINQLLSYNSKFTIYDETEYSGAHTLFNIFKSSRMGQAIALKVIGGTLGKTDVSGAIIPLGKLTISSELDKTNFAHAFISKFQNIYNSEYQTQRAAVSEATQSLLFAEKNSFSAQAQHNALIKSKQAILQNNKEIETIITDSGIKQTKKNNIQNIRKQLEQVLIIDETTKFSEKNFKDYGFKSGSLGANVEEQITNILWMFEQGGITNVDKDWLIFATLNSGPYLIGSHLRHTLEDYFSTAASLLLFRSGGVLAQQITESSIKDTDDNYIRIYRLGPLFVPNSYILQLTYDALSDANAEIAHSAYGSRAMIHNNVEKPVERKKKKNQSSDKTVGVWQWAETYAVNYPHVQINLQILGGFLDILEKLQERLNQF